MNVEARRNFGRFLRGVREQIQPPINQREMAEKIGVGRTMVTRVEGGDIPVPIEITRRWLEVAGYSPNNIELVIDSYSVYLRERTRIVALPGAVDYQLRIRAAKMGIEPETLMMRYTQEALNRETRKS